MFFNRTKLRRWLYFEICLGYRRGFQDAVRNMLAVSDALTDGARVCFACKQGKDRSVLLARAMMVHRGVPEHDAVRDNLRLTLRRFVGQQLGACLPNIVSPEPLI